MRASHARGLGPRALPALVLCALALSSWSHARADTATPTRFFDDTARRAYADGHVVAALRDFLLVDRATPSAGTDYNIAVTALAAKQLELSFSYLRRYLASQDQDAARRADAEQRLVSLRERLALVHVESEPPGAEIFVDLREHGTFGKTPLVIVVAPGEHRLELDLAGYLPTTVTVTAKKGVEEPARAQLSPRLGSLVVATTPPGATFQILAPGQSPRSASDGHPVELPIGSYRIHMESAGYEPAETVALVREGVTARSSLVAAPLPAKTGRLLVTAGGLDGQLFVDGSAAAALPATLSTTAVGAHRLEVRAKGYRTWTGRVVIREGQTAFVQVELQAIAPKGP